MIKHFIFQNRINSFNFHQKMPIKTLLKPTGSFPVGHIDMEFINPNDINSTILTRVFYPSSSNNSINTNYDTWIPSLSYYGGYGKVYNLPTFISKPSMRLIIGDLRLNSTYGLPILNEQKQLPILIFSHGLYGNRTTYSMICSEFASHGWLVFSIEHHDGSASHSFVKGKPLDFLKVPKNENEFETRNNQLEQRTNECLGLIEILKRLNSGDYNESTVNLLNDLKSHKEKNKTVLINEFFKSKLDFDSVIIAGHSFGGATAIRVSQCMDIFKCVLAYDPYMFPIESTILNEPKRSVPTFISNSANFQWEESLESILTYLKVMESKSEGEKRQQFISFKIKDTAHDYFSDIPSAVPKIFRPSNPNLADHYKIVKIFIQLSFEFLANCKLIDSNKDKVKTENGFIRFNSDLISEYP
jgi:platelet-activating factor acetylhydrolase